MARSQLTLSGWTQGKGGFRFAFKENTHTCWNLRHYEFTSQRKWWKSHCLGATREKTKFEVEDRGVRWHHGIFYSIPFHGGFPTSLLEAGLSLVCPCASDTRCWSRLGSQSFCSHPLTVPCPCALADTQQFHANSEPTRNLKRCCHSAPLPWLATWKHWLFTVKINSLGQWFSTPGAH